MKNTLAGFVLAFSLLTIPLTAPLTARAEPAAAFGPASLAPLVEKLLPAVVNISSTQKIEEAKAQEQLPEVPHFPPGSPFGDFFEEFMNRHGGEAPAIPPTSLGSGFVVDAEKGFVVTNAHVIQDADEVRVTLHDDTTMPAEVIGRDEKTDLALLKVSTDHKLTAVKFGDSDPLRVGDWVLAIGNPFGLGGTVTTGIISAQQRDINAGPYDDFIQTDASINRGNSGGPMFNMNGEVIGINTAIYSPSGGSVGIGFAIPSNLARPVIDQLLKYGHTRRGWLGVRIQTVTPDIAESLGIDSHGGALIASVTPTGPAEKAGLKAGDIILEFNGKSISQMRSLPRLVAETDIGKTVDLVFWRDGRKGHANVTVGELEKAEENGLLETGARDSSDLKGGTPVESVGITLRNLNTTDRSTYNVPADVEGVLVTEVKDNSEAAEKGLIPGDVIVEINQQPAADEKTAAEMIAKAAKAGRTSVLLLINREGEVRFSALRLKAGAATTPDKSSGDDEDPAKSPDGKAQKKPGSVE